MRPAAEFYRDVLGFELDPLDGVFQPSPDEPDGVYALVERAGACIHLQIRRGAPAARARAAYERDVYLYVRELDAVHTDLARRGAPILSPPGMSPHGMREMLVQDLDGHLLAFGELSASRPLGEMASTPDVTLSRMAPVDWRRTRAIRLRALAEDPDAFSRTLAEESARASEFWRERLASSAVATFVASREGLDVGLVSGGPWGEDEREAGLFGMWVAPAARGLGVSDRLVAAVIDWARASGKRRLLLGVADQNLAAIRLYARHGFEATGERDSLPPPRTHVLEHLRALRLTD